MPSNIKGYLAPTTPRYNINHLVHDLIAGICGLNNSLVRPKNQITPPPPPAFGTNWAAFGVSQATQDGFIYLDASKTTQTQTHYIITCSLYGVDAENNIKNLQAGVQIAQNWEVLAAVGLRFGGNATAILRVPELFSGRWLQRFDYSFIINQTINLKYDILTLISAGIDVNSNN